MRINEAATTLKVSARTLRHYEASGLLSPGRDANGYGVYTPADLRRAGRIRDMIGTGFSTREIMAIAPCLDDAHAGPCYGAVAGLEHKLGQMDRLIRELTQKRQAEMERLISLKASLGETNQASEPVPDSYQTPISLSDRLSNRRGRVPARTNFDADR